MKYTQRQIITNVLRNSTKQWTPSYALIAKNTKWGYLGTSADREARSMVEQGIIKRKRIGKYAFYSI